ncbi:hypothetical protein WK21_00010 [Burkholderia cepacia]|nr:hypothetical protein WK21_00010 [Burkholderia cepacia]
MASDRRSGRSRLLACCSIPPVLSDSILSIRCVASSGNRFVTPITSASASASAGTLVCSIANGCPWIRSTISAHSPIGECHSSVTSSTRVPSRCAACANRMLSRWS